MYSHSVMKNENTLNCIVDHNPTIDVMVVVADSYHGCKLNHDSYSRFNFPDNDGIVEVGGYFSHWEHYDWYRNRENRG